MSFFKKKGEVIDLTLLQKKGILKKSQNREIKEIIDILDLTQNQTPSNITNLSPPFSSQTSSQSSPFDLLDSLAQTNSNQSSNIQSQMQNADGLQDLKIKLENLEYQIERLMGRFNKIEDKLSSS